MDDPHQQTQTLPPQVQARQPGVETKMQPRPQSEARRYRAAGKLEGKVALITGGDSGIGKSVAIHFAKEGADIAIIYLEEQQDAERAAALIEAEGCRCLLLQGDVGDRAFCANAIKRTVAAFGRLDILVNNAAEQHAAKDFSDMPPEQFAQTFRTNVFGMFHLTQMALPHLSEGAAIINTTSVTAFRGSAGLVDYASTKGAIVSFTRSLALQLVEKGIRVNAVVPGPIWTPLIPARLEEIAWQNYLQSRKAPRTTKAGPGFADPEYELSDQWRATRDALLAAEKRQKDPTTQSRVLVIVGASRNDGSCPGEISKSFRLVQAAEEVLGNEGVDVDRLDLSLLTSDYARKIHPCKACVSTAMPLCHWPCSCYPNHALGEVNDWMAEIYERFVSAHGVMIVTPVYWDQAPGGLKLMMDRLVCADGGNPDPTSTSGKKPEKAKAIELAGRDYPKHLAGRAYGVVVHGDASGVEHLRQTLCEWLGWLGFIAAGHASQLDRYIGYFKPYATSHEDLDKDEAMFEEVRNVARALVRTVSLIREGRMSLPDKGLSFPRQK